MFKHTETCQKQEFSHTEYSKKENAEHEINLSE